MSNRNEYLKNYKKFHYTKTRKIVTVPLLNEEYEKLEIKASNIGIKVNKLAKDILLAYNDNTSSNHYTKEQKDILQEYMRISRGIATNINQMAYNSNIGEMVDINILINSLKKYEDEFKKLVEKI